MTSQTFEASQEISGLENMPIGENAETHAADSNSRQIGSGRSALQGVLENRKSRRRRNLSNLHGLMRDHGRLIGEIRDGRVSLEKGEVLSRAYSRHRDMVAAIAENDHRERIIRELAEANRRAGNSLPAQVLTEITGDGNAE